MNNENKLTDIEKRIYEFLSTNRIPSSLNKSASALEKLVGKMELLTTELRNASASSTKLATSLNRLTFAAVIIALVALIIEGWKLYLEIK